MAGKGKLPPSHGRVIHPGSSKIAGHKQNMKIIPGCKTSRQRHKISLSKSVVVFLPNKSGC